MVPSEVDQKIMGGFVTDEILNAFKDAELYGTAPPMQWLGGRLKLLAMRIREGGHVEVITGRHSRSIADLAQLAEWISVELPDAFLCFKNESWLSQGDVGPPTNGTPE